VVAVAAAILAVLLRLPLDSVWGSKLPYITSYPAVMVTAWLGGFGPGLATTLLCATAAAYFWLPPFGLAVADVGDLSGLLVFVAVSGVISGLGESRRRTMAALASEVETTRAFFESAAEGIVVVDQAGRIVRANPRSYTMFGYAQSELIGQPVERLLPERFRAAHHGHREHYFHAPRARPMGLGLDLFGRRTDGSEFPIEIGLTAIHTADGVMAMALVTDITERRSLAEAARQQEKLATLATLSAGIAHELNNPIGIVATRIELMLEEVGAQSLPAGVLEDLRVLHRNIQRISRIATGLLSYARRSPEEPEPVDVNTVVAETLLLVGWQLGKDGVQVSLALDKTLGPILGRGRALQQVLTNLLLNARDAMPGGGKIQIETGPHPDRAGWLRLVVEDAGEGMGPEGLAKLWEPFYTTKAAGTGLGLSVSRSIIEEHGGVVNVRSAPGSGTTFTLEFPLHVRA
jgi:PAS domain S-box-containing protein